VTLPEVRTGAAPAAARLRDGRIDLSRPVAVLVFYLGVGLSMHLADPIVLRWELVLIVGSVLGVLGWRQIVLTRTAGRYLRASIAFAVSIVLSSVWAWATLPFYRARILVIWTLLVVPGLASLLRDRGRLELFAGGLVGGATIFGLVASYRIVRGLSVFDLAPTYHDKFHSYAETGWYDRAFMLGQNRNIAATVAALAFPLILFGLLPRFMKRFRWPLLAVNAGWLVFSGSRLVPLAGVLVVVVMLLLQQRGSARVRLLYAVAFGAVVVVIAVQEIGGQALVGTERLAKGLNEGTSTEIRKLLVLKAYHLAIEHPVFGIGLGRFPGSYHPIVEDASTSGIKKTVVNSSDHNAFAGIAAEAGIPALAMFLALVSVLIGGALRGRDSPAVRIASCSFAVALLDLLAHSISPLTFGAAALMLGAIGMHEDAPVLEEA
jgi:O-antigen ligase